MYDSELPQVCVLNGEFDILRSRLCHFDGGVVWIRHTRTHELSLSVICDLVKIVIENLEAVQGIPLPRRGVGAGSCYTMTIEPLY